MCSSPSAGFWPAVGLATSAAACCFGGDLIGRNTGWILGRTAISMDALPAGASLPGWLLKDDVLRLECCLLLIGDPICSEAAS